MKPYAIKIDDKLKLDMKAVTIRDAITVSKAVTPDQREAITFQQKVDLIHKVLGITTGKQSLRTVNSYFDLVIDMSHSVGFHIDDATTRAKLQPTDVQPVTTVTVKGHEFMIPEDLGKESVRLMIGLENVLRNLPEGMHEVEVMPHVLGTLLREKGTEYDVNQNAARAELLHDMLLIDASRIMAFFFFSSTDFRGSLLQSFPRFGNWMMPANELELLSSLPAGEMLKRFFGLGS